MLRLIDVISASVLAAAACDSHQAQNTGGQSGSADQGSQTSQAGSAAQGSQTRQTGSAVKGSQTSQTVAKPAPPAPTKPTSVLEQVQQSAPAGGRVVAADLAVTGVELFVLTDGKPVPDDGDSGGKLVGVVGGLGGKLVEGNELVLAVIAAKPAVKMLARVALRVAQQDGEILDAPSNAEQRKARVRAPRIAGKALVFWVWTTGVPRMLEKGTLDRTTGALELAIPPVSHGVTITNAITALLDTGVSIDTSAIQLLAGSCAEPKVQTALLRALGSLPRPETRAAIADVAHKCGAAAVPPLIDAMENDKSRMVRPRAASALGRIGDGRARPALAKAARSEDANLVWAANNALKKLH